MTTALREDAEQLSLPGGFEPSKGSFVRGLSLLGAVALVVGNMVGTSMYTLPASLAAAVGPLGIVAWLLTALGYLGVALVYADLGTRYPRTGGPYVYAREAFGDFAGFISFWLYWISALIGNAGIVTGVVAYAQGFFPAMQASPFVRFAVALVLLWTFCAINVLGIRHSARLQIAIMAVNLGALFLLLGGSAHAIDVANYQPFAPEGWASLATGTALIVWAYSGVETATVPAEEVKTPQSTIWRGTMIGYAIGTVVFILAAIVVSGVLPNAEVASSARPLAMVVEKALGPAAAAAISIAAIVAGLGTLNGWMLVSGRVPVGAARDGLLPSRMASIHPRFGTPAFALVVSAIAGSVMLLMILSSTMLETFNFLVLLAVWATLVPHLITAAAQLALARRDPARYPPRERRRAHVIAPLAFVAMMYFVYGAGAEIGRWGFLLMAAGMLAYALFRRDRQPAAPDPETPAVLPVDPLQLAFPISFKVVTVAKTTESFAGPE
ncbi:MAG TPA: APC family permease [Gemmatimonadaceae bacterium]|nr:APC family permease [Gemmatimonadaceae bacterium]